MGMDNGSKKTASGLGNVSRTDYMDVIIDVEGEPRGGDAPRHRRVTIVHAPQSSPWLRGMREMVSLLIAALAGALATGSLATLIMMSAPAYAGSPPESHAPANPQLLVRLPRRSAPAPCRRRWTDPIPALPLLAARPPRTAKDTRTNAAHQRPRPAPPCGAPAFAALAAQPRCPHPALTQRRERP